MKYNGVSFNEKWVLSLTREQFVNHMSNRHLFTDQTRRKHLEAVYDLIKDKDASKNNGKSQYGNYKRYFY